MIPLTLTLSSSFTNQVSGNYTIRFVEDVNPAITVEIGDYIEIYHSQTTFKVSGREVHINDKLGIGTTSPAHALDVSGIIQVSNESTVISGGVANRLWLTPTGLYGFSIEPNTVSYNTWESHKFYTSSGLNNSEPRMTINVNNVGIGTTDPSYNLDVTDDGQIRTGKIHLYNDDQTIGTTSNTLALFGKNASGGIGFYTTDTITVDHAKMYITHAGNVGIGTTSPSEKLDVVGNAEISGTLSLGSTLNTATNIIGPSNNNVVLQCNSSSHALFLQDTNDQDPVGHNSRIAIYSVNASGNSNVNRYRASTHDFDPITAQSSTTINLNGDTNVSGSLQVTGTQLSTSENSTNVATTAWVQSLGFSTGTGYLQTSGGTMTGTLITTNKVFVNRKHNQAAAYDNPTIDLAIGDNDTGFN